VSWVRWSAAGLHRGVPGFASRPFHQRFVVEIVALWLVSVPIRRVSPLSIVTPMSQFCYGSTALVGLGHLIVLVSRLHPVRRTTLGRTPSGPVIRSSHRSLHDNTQHSKETDIHDPGEIRTRNPSKGAAADPRLRPRSHQDHQCIVHYLIHRSSTIYDFRIRQGRYITPPPPQSSVTSCMPLQ